MSLGERMREMRKMLRLSQEELAFRFGNEQSERFSVGK